MRQFVITKFIYLCTLVLLLTVSVPGTVMAKSADTWDGLTRVKSKRLDQVYLQPFADFRSYNKVILDETEISFRKNWQRDVNSQRVGTSGRISDRDARKILDQARESFESAFRKAFQGSGYEIVTTAGPDVLQVTTTVLNLDISAPETMAAGRTRTYSREAGRATLAVEVRDSLSGEILGRAVDNRIAGQVGGYLRNSSTNMADFGRLFSDWAMISVQGLNELKVLSPIDANGRKTEK